MQRISLLALLLFLASVLLLAQVKDLGPVRAHYDDARWELRGDGVVCCPCSVPCPCRSNGRPSYGHCEATLYLRINDGHYGDVSLQGMQLVSSGGMCASRQNFSALYFDQNISEAQRSAFMKLWASFSPEHSVDFPHVRVLPIQSEVRANSLFKVVIPGTLEMTVDRNWSKNSAPMPMVAAQDYFSNTLQYAQNIRYWIHDAGAGLDLDYSRRQANYRAIDLTDQQYRSKKMLIEFANGAGWFTPKQLQLIRAEGLAVPRVGEIREKALQLMREQRP